MLNTIETEYQNQGANQFYRKASHQDRAFTSAEISDNGPKISQLLQINQSLNEEVALLTKELREKNRELEQLNILRDQLSRTEKERNQLKQENDNYKLNNDDTVHFLMSSKTEIQETI